MCEKTFGENCKYQIAGETKGLFCYYDAEKVEPGQLIKKCEPSGCQILKKLFNGNNPYVENPKPKTTEEINKDEEFALKITKLYNFMEFLVSEENITENSYNMIIDLMNSIFEIEV